ncbi:MAG: class I SAM-dependent methyltransferase [Gammaproteobacteria bacterium]|nr:class I SAM-dependent methyltransferase [Gammaproteobacteria bacterium]
MEKNPEAIILESWRKNVRPWIQAVRGEEIESRTLVTNKAIVDTVLNLKPLAAFDIGCGEGWLVRLLQSHGIDALGIDAVPDLIEAAEKEGAGRFRTLSYDEITPTNIGEKIDVLICNFSLFGKDSVKSIFQSASQLLNQGGSFVIQTLHPNHVNLSGKSKEGWMEGTWVGFNSEFRDPPPWYFRTVDDWKCQFTESGFKSVETFEPVHPKTGRPASIIFTAGLF